MFFFFFYLTSCTITTYCFAAFCQHEIKYVMMTCTDSSACCINTYNTFLTWTVLPCWLLLLCYILKHHNYKIMIYCMFRQRRKRRRRFTCFPFHATVQQPLDEFSPNLHQKTSLWCYSLMLVPRENRPPPSNNSFWPKTSILWAQIHIPRSSEGRCAKTRK